MKLFSQPEGVRFSNRAMILFLLPVLFEQLMLAVLGVADTFMVSAKLGETALAGVALVNRIDTFAKQFLLAFSQGGSVVLAQYIGAKNEKYSKISLKANIQVVLCIGIALMLIMTCFKQQVVNLFFGNAEKEVLALSIQYLSITAISYPFIALYYSCGSLFRVMGESKIPFMSSVIMMVINLLLKYIFIFRLEIGIGGAALSTLLSMAIVGVVLLFMLTRKSNRVRLTGVFKLEFDKTTAGKILRVAFPNGMEQALFQLGVLLLAGVVSGLGMDAINADQVSRDLILFISSISPAFCALMLMVVGQCMGAGDIEEAKRYKKHILKIDHMFVLVVSVIFIIVLKPVLSAFNISEQSKIWVTQIGVFYAIASIFFYPPSFATPSALRGAGDTKFVMLVAAFSMFLFRIGCAYLCVHVFKIGVLGIWVAMVIDWIARSVIFEIRYKRGKWKYHHVI